MPNQNEAQASVHPSRKAFYILLCAILGALLFIVLQRSVALIIYLLLNTNYQAYSLGLNPLQWYMADVVTVLAAVFFGLWYGTWLGLHWYDIVYVNGRGGLLRAFHGHWIRAGRSAKSATAPVSTSVTIKPTTRLTDRPSAASAAADSWDLDELLKSAGESKAVSSAATKRRVAKPKVVAKTSVKRKTAVK